MAVTPTTHSEVIHLALLDRARKRTASINRPDAWGSDLDQMPVRVAKIDASAPQLPRTFLFYRDSVFRQPGLPARQFIGPDREREMQLTVAIVRRLHCARG